jgi:hypothetical protein
MAGNSGDWLSACVRLSRTRARHSWPAGGEAAPAELAAPAGIRRPCPNSEQMALEEERQRVQEVFDQVTGDSEARSGAELALAAELDSFRLRWPQ